MPESMHISDVHFRLLIEQIPAIMYTATLEKACRPLYISPQVESILGIPPANWVVDKELFVRQIHPDDRDHVLSERAVSASTGNSFCVEYRMVARDGHIVWFRDQARVVRRGEETRYFQGIMLEITDRKQLEYELFRWDQETRSLTENIPDIIARFDRQFRYLYLNRSIESHEAVPAEVYLGKTNHQIGIPTEVAAMWEGKLCLVFEKGLPKQFEFFVPTSKGIRYFESRLLPECNSQGRVVTVLSVTRDITERKESEAAIRESEERFRQLAESIDDVFWLSDTAQRRIVYVSPAYERLWGASSQELYEDPETWLKVVHEEDRSMIKDRFIQKIVTGSLDAEYRIMWSDGTIRWIHDRAFPIRNERSEVYRIAGIAEDITERKKFEEERLRVGKLDSLGLLAGGIAHDFNNLLTAILGQLSLAKFSVSPDDRLFYRLTEAETASLRAQDLTQQLLTFARGGSPIKKAASLQQVVEENAKFVLTGSNVKSYFQFPNNLWTVEIDVGQISQVVQNLVINAKQAMPNGGELTIQGNNVVIGPERGRSLMGVPAGKWVRISFMDQGIGISKEHLVKIFDPYFTTKTTGTGLGLATSYSIIKNHGGLLTVDSEVGAGTTFTMFLPVSVNTEVLSQQKEANIQIGKGKILVMDDEAPVRGLLSEMLELCGYTYQTAKDGAEALNLFWRAREKGMPFHAIILDLTIPGGIGGREVLQKMIEIDPEVKAIVVSGYSNDPVLANFQDYGFKGRVAKPFKLAELSEVIHKAVECDAN